MDNDNKKKTQKSEASKLIYRLEKETSQRLGDDDDRLIVAGLLGAMSRIMGQSPPSYQKRDDVVAGLMIQHQMSPDAIAALLSGDK